MKKVLMTLTVAAIATTSFAQSFGVQVGGNLASQSYKYDNSGGITISTKSKFGLILGVVAEMPITEAINFRPELNYIQKGSKFTSGTDELTTTLNYLELPLNFVYNAEAGSGNAFFGLGPVIGLGLSGTEKSKSSGSESTTKVKFDGKDNSTSTDDFSHLKSIDFGLNLIAGYKFENGVFANVGYAFGLSNISPDNGGSLKNSGLSIKVGYFFTQADKKSKKK